MMWFWSRFRAWDTILDRVLRLVLGGIKVGSMSSLMSTVMCLSLHCWGCICFVETSQGQVLQGVPACCLQVVRGSLAGADCVVLYVSVTVIDVAQLIQLIDYSLQCCLQSALR